jgi:PTH1 family peptidyl-tRNA hydrolase
MRLVIGLGNPGSKYKNNRHNVGHMVIDALLRKKLPKGLIAKKTTVFMNESGKQVKKLTDFYKISPDDLYIIHDDLDIPLGKYKIQKGKGPRQHNGIQSVDESLGTKEYWRVRIGVDNRKQDNRISGEEYVLQDFTKEEREVINQVIDKCLHTIFTGIQG